MTALSISSKSCPAALGRCAATSVGSARFKPLGKLPERDGCILELSLGLLLLDGSIVLVFGTIVKAHCCTRCIDSPSNPTEFCPFHHDKTTFLRPPRQNRPWLVLPIRAKLPLPPPSRPL